MNICFINPTKRLRGGIKGLSQYLIPRGHVVTILTPQMPANDELGHLSSASVIVYPSIFLPKIRYTVPSFIGQLRLLRQLAKREKIDIIHIWEYFYPAAWVPLLYAKAHGIPTVLTLDSFPGVSWKYGSRFVDLTARIYTKSIGKAIIRHCDKVILLHSSLMNTAEEIGIKQANMCVVPNSIDLARFSPSSNIGEIRESLGIRKDEAMILNVGRLVPVKGIDTLIEITRKLLNDSLKVKTVIVGDGPYRKEYEKKAENLGGNVIFTGFRTDIPEIISACDVFVLPSLSEGLPSALLEAAAFGKPVIASNMGGAPEIIIHEKTGFLAEPKDVDAFVHYIKVLLSNGASSEMGQKARRFVEERFNWENTVKKMEGIYSAFLAEKG
jgi:glycosyltransferase involved in cell wall biosynthesis